MANTDVRARPFAQESGQILVMTAVTMVALLGIAALSLDVSFMYDKRNRLHAAADAAAKSAAIEVFRNPGTVTQASLEAFADQQVTALGFSPSRLGGTTSVVVNHGPVVGPNFIGNDNYVEVIVSEPTSTFFARIIGRASMTPTASAIAGSGNPSNCLITKQNLTIGNSTIDTNGCGVAVGGNLAGTNPGSEIIGTPTPSVAVSGTCSGTCGAMGSLTQGAPTPTDPLAGLAAPPQTGVNCPAGAPGTAAVLSPGCYTSIANTVKTLTAGIYYITGPVNIDSLAGTNVMLYLTGAGQLTAQNNKSLTITAPTSGTYKGIAIFQDSTDLNDIDIKNSFQLTVTGVMYFPGTNITFKNGLQINNTTCTLFIGKSLDVNNGQGTFTNTGCAGLYGGAAFLSVSIAQ